MSKKISLGSNSNKRLSNTALEEFKGWGAWLAQLEEHGTLDLGVVGSSPHWVYRYLKIIQSLKKKKNSRVGMAS